MPTLFTYFRSSAAYRVRIALALKGIEYDRQFINLFTNEQKTQAYRNINPQGLVPYFIDEDTYTPQSLAILEYLEHKYPTPALLPSDIQDIIKVKSLAYDIACDIHPLNNLRVLKYLTDALNVSDEQKSAWYAHWIKLGFAGIEQRLEQSAGKFCVGDSPTWADCCLIPQVYNAKRFHVDISPFQTINHIYDYATSLTEFIAASPEHQADSHL